MEVTSLHFFLVNNVLGHPKKFYESQDSQYNRQIKLRIHVRLFRIMSQFFSLSAKLNTVISELHIIDV